MNSRSESAGVRLATDRLRLRPGRVGDAVVHRELWAERDPRVPPHRRIDADGRPTLRDLEDSLRSGPQASGLGLLAVELRDDGRTVGYCGLVEGGPGSAALDGQPPGPEIAFELLSRAQGQGYATEAARAVVEWSRREGLERLHATVWSWNSPSLRVLEKLGFEETARTSPDGASGDMVVVTLEL
ncbi:MAG: GNAT family N-acetyltransferase [Brachybacterium tyrofermentans]|uniref:GNAT family N-acetyltransferase n=1 Tax=Brachybacterium tyrofermentans TaxID=47848 RepID=A0ABW0FH19_9MICO